MRFKKHLLAIIFLLNTSLLIGQEFTQIIRGKIVDESTQSALVGATVQLLDTDYAVTTDDAGKFRLENIPVGRYQLVVNYLGYKKVRIPEVLVETGKEVIRNIELQESIAELDEVVVRAERERVIHPVSTRTITVEETRRFPATFFDPARLAASYAGVINANDQANALIIRGNSPASLSWQIAGAEIVNPNHTPNAGTFSDRPTFNGGGVNILSAQMLDNSTLLTGAFPVQYGNALSGVLDMNFRAGNNEKYEFTGQAGLIGIDLAAEGPLRQNSEASFLINYRYSTIGLLGTLGVPLGDEEINFQDLSFNLHLPTSKAGDFNIFGMGGKSENIFAAQRDTSIWEEAKDRMDINFASKMGALGMAHRVNLTSWLRWNSTYVYSGTENIRTSDRLTNNLELLLEDTDDVTDTKSSLLTQLTIRPNVRQEFSVGTTFLEQDFDSYSVAQESDSLQLAVNFYQQSLRILRPFINWRSHITDKLLINVGLTDQIYFYDGIFLSDKTLGSTFYPGQVLHSIEPRLSIKYQLSTGQSLSMAYGKHSQFQSPYRRIGVLRQGIASGDDPIFNRADHLVLRYEKELNYSTRWSAEAYWQHLDFEPFIPVNNELVQQIDRSGLIHYPTQGTNYGLELSLQKYITSDFYYLLNASLYSATFENEAGIKNNSRYNSNYAFNATAGKEWQRQKEKRITIFGVNARFNYRGGFRQTPINLERSSDLGYTFYTDQVFSEQQADFYKLDIQVYWKRNKTKYSNTLALDIQNVTNRKNVAFDYYDIQQQKVITKYQLGIIPIISYRIEF